MTVATIKLKRTVKRCHVCKTRLKIHEGELCSCPLLLCMKHRYKAAHSCHDGKVATPLVKVQASKIEMI